jgi:serine/threonine protein kinase
VRLTEKKTSLSQPEGISIKSEDPEGEIMLMLTEHPFIIKVHSIINTDSYRYYIMEYVPGGDLFELL